MRKQQVVSLSFDYRDVDIVVKFATLFREHFPHQEVFMSSNISGGKNWINDIQHKLKVANARLLNPDSLPVNLITFVGHGKILMFSFVGCKPCKDLKKTLLDFSADDSQLKKRLIFITNGRISSFEQFKKYDQYPGISNYYDSAGILSDQYVPESLFPVTCILKENGTVLKYPGFTYTNKNIIYEIIKQN